MPFRQEWDKRKIDELFLFSKEKKTAFVYLPKCGCSTLRKIVTDTSKMKNKSDDKFEEIRENLKDYKLAAIVRNPYYRLISGYLSEAAFLKKDHLGFKKFVYEFCKPDQTNVHFVPLTKLIKTTENLKILKFEELENVNNFLSEHGFEYNFSNVKENVSKNKSKEKLIDLLKNDKELKDFIYEFFKKDFKTFNYLKTFP